MLNENPALHQAGQNFLDALLAKHGEKLCASANVSFFAATELATFEVGLSKAGAMPNGWLLDQAQRRL